MKLRRLYDGLLDRHGHRLLPKRIQIYLVKRKLEKNPERLQLSLAKALAEAKDDTAAKAARTQMLAFLEDHQGRRRNTAFHEELAEYLREKLNFGESLYDVDVQAYDGVEVGGTAHLPWIVVKNRDGDIIFEETVHTIK